MRRATPMPTGPSLARRSSRSRRSGSRRSASSRLRRVPEVKGVKGLTSPGKVPEMLEKGILRASHGVSVYQDGTSRFDLTDLPLTHFRPGGDRPHRRAAPARSAIPRIGAGAPLDDPDQLLELAPQDLDRVAVLPQLPRSRSPSSSTTSSPGSTGGSRSIGPTREEDLIGAASSSPSPRTPRAGSPAGSSASATPRRASPTRSSTPPSGGTATGTRTR